MSADSLGTCRAVALTVGTTFWLKGFLRGMAAFARRSLMRMPVELIAHERQSTHDNDVVIFQEVQQVQDGHGSRVNARRGGIECTCSA
jgi:hypothetical protein